MATISFSSTDPVFGFSMVDWDAQQIIQVITENAGTNSPTQLIYDNGNPGFSFHFVADGTFSNFNAEGDPTQGTITGYQFTFSNGTTSETITVTGLSIPVQTFFNLVNTNNVPVLNETIFAGADTMTGTDLREVIAGYGEIDTINAGGGDDSVYAGAGNDIVDGGAGNDTLRGDIGNDNMSGGADQDHLIGQDGDDTLNGDDGADQIEGDSGNDTISGGTGNDLLDGVTGNDHIDGGDGNDDIDGGSGIDTLIGGAGNDILDGEGGADTMTGGDGDDAYFIDDLGDVITENSGAGVDRVVSTIAYTLGSNIEQLRILGATHISATGNALDNTINGNDGNNLIDGKAGADAMIGGKGDDTYIVDNSGDTITERLGEGLELVQSSVSYTLSIQVENLILLPGLNLNGTGNAINNEITGNSGANVLDGAAGDDTLKGQQGDDTLIGGAGADQLVGGAGIDTVSYANSAAAVRVNFGAGQGLDSDAQGDRYSSIEIAIGSNFDDRFTGGDLGDTFRGGQGADTLLGQNGNDVLDGGAGIDNLNGGNGNDHLVGGAGADQLSGGTGIDTIDYSASSGGVRVNISANVGLDNDAQGDRFNSIEGVIGSAFNDRFTGATQFGDNFRGGDGDDTLLGQAGNDLLFGEAGNDTLTGGGNDDLLNGGLGADILNGGAGLDTFVFADALGVTNVDSITGFSVTDDVISLSTAIFGVVEGTLSASAFTIGAAAADASDRIIYNSATGALLYDADGNGAGAAVQFATLGTGLALTNADFFGFTP